MYLHKELICYILPLHKVHEMCFEKYTWIQCRA